GKLDSHRLMELGIPPGPIYGELKKGKTIRWKDGQLIHGPDFLSPPIPGKVIVYLGDTQPTPTSIQLAHQADLLIHEATFSEALAKKAIRFQHSTTKEAARIAKEAEVNVL